MLNRMDRLVGSHGFFGADDCISYDDTAELAGGDFAEVVLAKSFLPSAIEQPGIVKATSWVDGIILEAHGKASVDGTNMGRVVWSDPLRNGRSDELLAMSLSWQCD